MASLAAVPRWHDETDVLVAGYGVAGAAAAIEAHDADPRADILVVEKAPEREAGGNGRVSGQSLLVSRDAEALFRYQKAMSFTNPPPDDMLREWARRMVALEPWIEARVREAGTRYVRGSGWSEGDALYEFPEYGAKDAVAYNSIITPIPSGVWLTMKAGVEKRPRIRRAFECPVVDLVQDPDTLEVYGAIVEQGGARRAIRARRGVVLATGGYEADLELQRNYFGFAEIHPLGTPYNTGDGLRILQKAGAELWHLRNFGQSGGIWPGIRIPGVASALLRRQLWTTWSWLEIAADDARFYDEGAPLHHTHYKERRHGWWVDTPHSQAMPVHMLFDEHTRRHNCLVTRSMSWATVVEGHRWSEDNADEVAKGWILAADSIEALAAKMGRDPRRVRATVDRYHDACRQGRDADFGRAPHTLQPLQEPPYYAVQFMPTIVCTSGGAKRNIESEVLTRLGTPIPRLYEAGELGSMISHLYQNGSYLTEAMISGRAAGANAVRQSPWATREAA